MTLSIMTLSIWYSAYDTQHNDIEHNVTQYSDTQSNSTEHNGTVHNDTQHNVLICNTQHHSIECHDTDCRDFLMLWLLSICWMSLCWVSWRSTGWVSASPTNIRLVVTKRNTAVKSRDSRWTSIFFYLAGSWTLPLWMLGTLLTTTASVSWNFKFLSLFLFWNSWFKNPATVNAWYSPNHNSISKFVKYQGRLSEGDGSVQLTSLYWLV